MEIFGSSEILIFEVETKFSKIQKFVTTAKMQNFITAPKMQNFVTTTTKNEKSSSKRKNWLPKIQDSLPKFAKSFFKGKKFDLKN